LDLAQDLKKIVTSAFSLDRFTTGFGLVAMADLIRFLEGVKPRIELAGYAQTQQS
jgi:hypothetical protein